MTLVDGVDKTTKILAYFFMFDGWVEKQKQENKGKSYRLLARKKGKSRTYR
ncbi:hypothetical protein GCM10010917_15930 [Paenibacillus physcomitrellae]|uniref:Uncharacterized protein n=1 Tax=Paenibacillus physcomitrellae TaxID=1619311 RepID=A0ABQ1FVW8_9BACL|nr:hypothetical protein GCM10010917_15930 [Paenibacillus physcomitrellae]